MNRIPLLLLVVIASLAGCAQNIPYRSDSYADVPSCREIYSAYDKSPNRTLSQEAAANPCWKRPKEEHDDYDLLFVEFDDQGWVQGSSNRRLPARDHLDAFYAELERLYEESQKIRRGLSLVVFVHGWHHNAAATDQNVHAFRRMLSEIAIMEQRNAKSGGGAMRVLGIFVGWRGESVTMPLLRKLTFWDRKNTAERVAQGAIRDFFAKMDYVRDSKRAKEDRDKRTVRMLTIGHSFGGLIVFESLSSEFLRNTVRYKGVDYVSRVGDLVVIVNPAFEGARYEPLRAASQRMIMPKRNQLPVVIVATSKADWATGILFPLARSINTIFESQPGEEFDATVKAVGHDERYITHDLALCRPDDQACNTVCNIPLIPRDSEQVATQDEIYAEYDFMKSIAHNGFAKRVERQYLCGGMELRGTDRWNPDNNPFWVVRTTKDIMRNHDDIFNANFSAFVRQMYLGIIAARFGGQKK